MSSEPNYAEFEKQVFEGTLSIAAARRMGATHFAYGWAKNTVGGWSADRVAAYNEGYDAAKKEKSNGER